MSGLGAAMTGGNKGLFDDEPCARPREENDFYPTPSEVTAALMEKICGGLREYDVWEPACGDGQMARVIQFYVERMGVNVIATDLVDRGYGKGGENFLTASSSLAPAIITNPPFDIAEGFVRKAWMFPETRFLALLLKATFWHAGVTRGQLWRTHRPSMVLPITWRPDFMGLGRPLMDVCWNVWFKQHSLSTDYDLLFKPRYLLSIIDNRLL